jgi:hypothetical protein
MGITHGTTFLDRQPEQNPYADSTMARDQKPPPSDLQPNSELGVDTKARNIVAVLTEIPERFIAYVDDNVIASMDRSLAPRVLANPRVKVSHPALA